MFDFIIVCICCLYLRVLCVEYPAVNVGSVSLLNTHVAGNMIIKPGLLPHLVPLVEDQVSVESEEDQCQDHVRHDINDSDAGPG